MNQFVFFWLFLKASLFSTGGMGNLPSLHDDLIPRGWATERYFGESLAVGQISPGPNGLWVICLGYLTNGLLGALMAVVAISIPPLLVLAVEKMYHRIKSHPAVEGFVQGLNLAVAGISVVILMQLLRAGGLNARTLLLAAAGMGLGLLRRVPVLVILGAAAVIGILLYGGKP